MKNIKGFNRTKYIKGDINKEKANAWLKKKLSEITLNYFSS